MGSTYDILIVMLRSSKSGDLKTGILNNHVIRIKVKLNGEV